VKNEMGTAKLSYGSAYQLTLNHISPLSTEWVGLSSLNDRVLVNELRAQVDSPSADVSLKDGYAIRSEDIHQASPQNPVALLLTGSVAAGGVYYGEVKPGTAVRILSGAPLPPGAQAVVAEEFTHLEGERVVVTANAHPGRNVLSKGSDFHKQERIAAAGAVLQPAQIGLIAAAGFAQARVYHRPQVAIIATGDEVVAPGNRLPDGKLFASNLVTLAAWCSHYGMQVVTEVVKDDSKALRQTLAAAVHRQDAVLTSGGAWSGDRDLVVRVLEELGWQEVYHRVKIGPGKAVGFGLLEDKPVFCLPGGPPSNYMAFLNLALPGLMKLAGWERPGLPTLDALLSKAVSGRIDWTQFVQGNFERREGRLYFHPLQMASRLKMMAQAQGLITIPEGREHIPAGEVVEVQVLFWPDRGG
jgi:molybdopterin molybdotransferase